MPRISKGPRLVKRDPVYRDGKLHARGVWIIRDGDKFVSTGCAAQSSDTKAPAEAEQKLKEYIADKWEPSRTAKDIGKILCAEVLAIYHSDKGEEVNQHDDLDGRIERLNEYWGDLTLLQVNPATCKGYVKTRPSTGGARRDLETLRAAINHHSAQNLHYGKVNVTLPKKGESRKQWLTRSEAARIIWAAWRYREVQTVHVGPNKGQKVATEKRPLRHVARFILMGLYTGTRAGAVASASHRDEFGKSYVDLEEGIFYRLKAGAQATNKRQPPVRIPPRLLAHMRRWVRVGASVNYFVEYNGNPVASVKKGFGTAVVLSKIEKKVTPHTLRHTAATWLMQRAAPEWQTAGYLGMSVEVLRNVYGHHHPDHMRGAMDVITKKTA